ncbi:TPA: hypothetical protein L5670_000050 [Pseudomonas aeruginosa]|nr:hypothetical protein AL512_000090 [Pseudomonas aeruginosa]PNN33789.1 hypothetical protein AL512_004170 [Pseudomonas aeruginosa]PXB54619.1 hypothetical protein C0056_08405 [Pseudomonas aeruginosa]RPO38606.1 hypothetical protein IPC1191_26155 [Pseudomonas aeruginosa]RPO49807.1 hypothetical protein IPC1190_25835 [Pseudomonas aeruginosa]
MNKSTSPGKGLLDHVRAGFVARGTSLNKWCEEQGILYPNARQALIGSWNGPKGIALRERLIQAASDAHV